MKILCICLSATIQRTLVFDQLVPESVNRSKAFLENASGKALNTARVLNQLEKDCSITVCPIGTQNRSRFLQLAEDDRIRIVPVSIKGNTRQCWTLLGKNGSTTEIVADEPGTPGTGPESFLLDTISSQLKDCSGVIFAGSCPSVWNKDLPSKICRLISSSEKPVLVDYWGESLLKTLEVSCPQFIKINQDEFQKTFGQSVSETSLKKLAAKYNTSFVITRGKESTLACIDGSFYECDSQPVTVVNTTACGDSFNAGFMHEWLSVGDAVSALKKGTWCAARNAESLVPGSIIPVELS